MNKKEKLQKNIDIIENELDVMKKTLSVMNDEPTEYKRFYPKIGDMVWFVCGSGDIICLTIDTEDSEWFLQNTIFFRTKEEAQRYKKIHTTIMDIASKYPVGDEAEEWYEFAIRDRGRCFCCVCNEITTSHSIKISKDIDDEIKTALSSDDLLFYRSVT